MTNQQKRAEIKRILPRLEESNRNIFMKMYSHDDLNKDINTVVDELSAERLDWALQQCKNTYYKIFNILKGNA